MNYQEVHFNLKNQEDFIPDILAAQLAEVGFESFVREGDELLCYCPETEFDESAMRCALNESFVEMPNPSLIKKIEEQNWNEEWEQNSFEPIEIDGQCVVHDPKKTVNEFEYDILIAPKLAFGTGYHETTHLLISRMMRMDFQGKTVLDMGCGTAVLAILSSKMGAKSITAIDIDKFSYDNARSNATLNGVANIDVKLGGKELLHDMAFDIILANINRNILIRDMASYCGVLRSSGQILFSGFYTEDIPILEKQAKKYGLAKEYAVERNGWAVVCFYKKG